MAPVTCATPSTLVTIAGDRPVMTGPKVLRRRVAEGIPGGKTLKLVRNLHAMS